MDKKEFLSLVKKYNNGLATEEERAFLDAYDQLFEVEDNILDQLSATDKGNLKESMRGHIKQQIEKKVVTTKKTRTLDWRWTAAAALIIFSSVALLFKFADFRKTEVENVAVKTEVSISPGSNQAILTLGSGNKIILNEETSGLLSTEAGVIITKNEDGVLKYEVTADAEVAINTVTTPRGGQYQLVLADGTRVWLNADSKITFPTRFDGSERAVEVSGEAYFEVAKNKNKPFKVLSEHQLIEVLGTHFNVNNYEDETIAKTTLLEGSIKISSLSRGIVNKSSSKILQPREQAQIAQGEGLIEIVETDMETAVAWKNGYFKFNRTDMKSMMRQVARWYDVEVKYKGQVSNDLFAGNLKRSDDIKEVIRILQLSKVNASIEGKTIIISN